MLEPQQGSPQSVASVDNFTEGPTLRELNAERASNEIDWPRPHELSNSSPES